MIGWFVFLLAALASQIILICGDDDFAVMYTENLALHKLTNQSSGETSHLAVNGNYADFAEIASGNYKWWLVDLGEEATVRTIKVHNQWACCNRILEKIHMLTSTSSRPGTPNKLKREWTERFFRIKSATKFMLKVFDPMIAVRHVAVTSENSNKMLAISEVEISGGAETSNVARGKPAFQSAGSGISENPAPSINNGLYDDCSFLDDGWWRVDLLQLYTTYFIRIFVGSSVCHERKWPFIDVFSINKSSAHGTGWTEVVTGIKVVSFFNMFTENRVMRQVRVLTNSKNFSLTELELFVHPNLAFKKSTWQESTNEHYVSDLAVNGNLEDFTQTMITSKPRWWTVDLLSIYMVGYIVVHKVENVGDNSAVFYLWTSKNNNSMQQRDYTDGAYYSPKKVYLDSNREIRYITITQEKGYHIYDNTFPLSLVEVIVKEYNFASYCETDQASSLTGGNPQNAVDGSYTTYTGSFINYNVSRPSFWSVKLNKTVQMTSVAVYFKGGECFDQQRDWFYACPNWDVYIKIKTSKMASPQGVTSDEDAQWSLCYKKKPVSFKQIHLECNRNQRYPLTRHLSILPLKDNLQQFSLTEVEIYGRQLPELNSQTNVSVIYVDVTSMTISFPIWNLTNTGTFPPSLYVISLGIPSNIQHVEHKRYANVGGISVILNDLYPNTTYTIHITCQYEGVTCPGPAVIKIVATTDCTAPDEPQVEWSFVGERKNRSLNVSSKDVDSHCIRITEYRVTLQTANFSVFYDQSTELVQDHIISGVASDLHYYLTVKVTNNFGMSKSYTTILYPAEPNLPTLTTLAFNSSCVHISVALQTEQLYQKLQFKFTCTAGIQSQKGTSDGTVSYKAHKVFCGFPNNTLVECEVQAENNFRGGPVLTVEGFTANATNSVEPDTVTNLEATTVQDATVIYTLSILGGLLVLTMSVIFVTLLIKRRNRIKNSESLQMQQMDHMRK